MNKFSIDYSQLTNELATKKVIKLSDVKDRVEKVAWDVVRFVDSDNIDNLWKIERQGEDEVIVSMYTSDDKELEAKASVVESKNNLWAATLDKTGSYVNVFYKEEPIKKIAISSLGVAAEDGKMLARNLPKMLSSNNTLVKKMLNDSSSDECALLFSKYPELNK